MSIARLPELRVRRLDSTDLSAVQRILETSDYIHYRFGPEELAGLLDSLPAVGAFSKPSHRLAEMLQGSLQGFLLLNWLVPPSAWIGGFGVTWSEGDHFDALLELLLPPLETLAFAAGARTLYYSGNDLDTDWLRSPFEALGFTLHSVLRSYDKEDYVIPSQGNMQVRVRPFTPDDVAGVVAVEDLTFEQLWRHNATSFLDVQRTYPYFVVAEDDAGIAGYQYNTVDEGTGYLVRIAVHPRVWGQGVGTRLMAEAVRYFQAHHALKIVLNTQESNGRAQALYEWFGFHMVYPRGYVLERPINPHP